jgi:DNA-binding NarL/FixJ family response regulator
MRLAVCCKEGLFGEALACLLDHHGSYQVVASEENAHALVKSAKDQHAHVLIVDAYGLGHNDLQFVLGARAFGDFAIILIVDEASRDKYAEVPVDRVILRSSPSEKLFDALVELGGVVRLSVRPFLREGRRGYGRSANELSRREYECAQLVAKGMSNRKIAHITGLREQSVKNLVSVIMRKLNCENRVQVALKLTQAGPRSDEIASDPAKEQE